MRCLRRSALVLLGLLAAVAAPSAGQAPLPPGQGPVFSSSQAANLSTATTLRPGDLQFEISHRFNSPVSDGADALWGLDGGVFYRLGLSWGVSERVTVGVLRTNLEDNLELHGRVRLWERAGASPLALGARGGIAWNTQPFAGAEDNEAQGYLQLLLEAGVGERLALGVVPTWIRNPRIRGPEPENGWALGLHGQLEVADDVRLLGEWIVSEAREELAHDTGVLGVELETRGHFFKLLLTNQVRINPTQFLGGAPVSFDPDNWRVAFNILRRISF